MAFAWFTKLFSQRMQKAYQEQDLLQLLVATIFGALIGGICIPMISIVVRVGSWLFHFPLQDHGLSLLDDLAAGAIAGGLLGLIAMATKDIPNDD